MGNRVFLLGLQLRRTHPVFGKIKNRIVSESGAARRFIRDEALKSFLHRKHSVLIQHQHHAAYEKSPSVLPDNPLHGPQEKGVPFLGFQQPPGLTAAETCRAHPRRTPESRHRQTRIIRRDNPPPNFSGQRTRLDQGILQIRIACFISVEAHADCPGA